MINEQILTFNGDAHQLVGTLHLPDQTPAPMIIGCHGLLANRHSPKQIALAQACCAQGIGYLRFDFQGCGDSTGDFAAGTALDARCADLRRAVATLDNHPHCGPLLGLFGSSFGGTVVLAYGAGNQVPVLVTYAAPINSQDLSTARMPETLPSAIKATLQDQWRFDITPDLKKISYILVVHAQGDAVVPAAHAQTIHRQAREPKRLWIQPGGDHPMSDPQLQKRFLSQALDWYQRGLDGFGTGSEE